MKILIVDDHVLFREGLASIIRGTDFEIVGLAGTVQEAVDSARQLKPDIILMDFSLPDGTGAEATRRILEVHPKCKIIFLTVSDEDENLFEAIRAGAKGYLLKNISPSKLASAIRSVQQGESALSRTMTMHVMEELARTKKDDHPADPILTKLTQRELEVLRELGTGKTNPEIARLLSVSENTVRYHVHSIYEKLGISDRRAVASLAREHGLIK